MKRVTSSRPRLIWEPAIVMRWDKPMDSAVADMRQALLSLRKR